MHILFCTIINSLYLILEQLFDIIYDAEIDIGFIILLISFIMFIIFLPLYIQADNLQAKKTKTQENISDEIKNIKKNNTGFKKLSLLLTCYRKNNYHKIISLNILINLLLQIPLFIAVYYFFGNLPFTDGESFSLIKNLALPDNLIKIGNYNINLLPILIVIINIHAGFIYAKNKNLKQNKTPIIISLIFLLFLYNAPSAITLYFTFNNLFF